MLEIVSRKEAVTLGLKKYFTGKSCKHGHVSERYISSWKCTACSYASHSVSYSKNKDIHFRRSSEWRERNRERINERRRSEAQKTENREKGQQYYKKNKDKILLNSKLWYGNNIERKKERHRNGQQIISRQ
jgi:hypothetical protein